MQVQANGIVVEVDVQGPQSGTPLLLVMGLGMQLTAWPQRFVDQLVAMGFRVIRFDNRDSGLSQGFDHLGVPNLLAVSLRHALHLPVRSAYRIEDLAADAFGVLDALGIERAHVCGASMGGMVAQTMAFTHPDRVLGLTLMMTSSGARHLPQARLDVRQALLRRPPRGAGPEQLARHLERFLELIGSPGYRPDPDEVHTRIVAAVRRAYRPAGVLRQLAAIVAQGDRSSRLRSIVAPTVVIHGESDPLIPAAAADDLARKISGARVERIQGMGHDLPEPLLSRFAQSIATLAQKV